VFENCKPHAFCLKLGTEAALFFVKSRSNHKQNVTRD